MLVRFGAKVSLFVLLIISLCLCACDREEQTIVDPFFNVEWKLLDNPPTGWSHHCIVFHEDNTMYYRDEGDRPSGASYFLPGNGKYSKTGDYVTFDFKTDTKLIPSNDKIGFGWELTLISGELKNGSFELTYSQTYVINKVDYETKQYTVTLYRTTK